MIPLHQTPMGKKYYDVTLPDLVVQIKRVANALEDVADTLRAQHERTSENPIAKGTPE